MMGNKKFFIIILWVLTGVIFGKLIIGSPYSAAFMVISLFIALLFIESPIGALLILIFLIPFSGINWLNKPVIPAPGANLLLLLGFFVLFIATINYKQSFKLPRYTFFYIILLLILFVISIIHSLPNLDIYNSRMALSGRGPYSILTYTLKTFVRPLIFFIPFIIIVKYANNTKQLTSIVNTIVLSTLALSVSVIYVLVFKIGGKPSIRVMHEAIQVNLGMHRNLLTNFFAAGFPFILARFFLKKNFINMLMLALTVSAIGFSYSRTGYVVLIVSTLFYLFITKRAKFLPVLIIVALGLSFVVSASIIERASKGIDSGDREEVSGRIDHIWLPLIGELAESPKQIFFGNGRFAIISSQSVAMGITGDTMLHPHNMYLEVLLDTGLVGLVIFMSFFAFLAKKILFYLNRIGDFELKEYYFASIVSLFSFFLAGITGRSLFPGPKNSYFWIVVGITMVMIKNLQDNENDNDRIIS